MINGLCLTRLNMRKLPRRLTSGFTITELLTVIAIMVVLLSVLLPSMGSVRRSARTAICVSNLHQAGIGFRGYAANNLQFIPGPNTSGFPLLNKSPSSVESPPTEPITADDWISPTLGLDRPLPRNKVKRLTALFNDEFQCPENDKTYDYIYPSSGGFPDASEVSYNSYSAPFPLHYYWDATHAAQSGQAGGAVFGNSYDQAVDIRTAKHRFRTTTLGSASGKVAATEGARYIDSHGRVSFNRDAGSRFGGNFMNRSPTLNVYYQNNGSPYKFSTAPPELHSISKAYAYRHPNDSINAVFFDGHAKTLSNLESRQASFWFPSGSTVVNASLLGDETLKNGDVVR